MRHPLVQLTTFAAMLIILNFAVDVIYGGFGHHAPVAGFKQAVTGA